MIALIGEIAEKRELSGDESLTTLVNTFTDEKALISEERPLLPEMETYFMEQITNEHNEIKKVAQNLIKEIIFPSQGKDITNALRHLMIDYICKEFGVKYDRISPELFGLERVIKYGRDMRKNIEGKDLVIPLLAGVNFGRSVWELETEITEGYHTDKIKLKSVVPPITREVKERAKQAIVDYMGICSKTLKEPFIGDVALGYSDFMNPLLDLKMYWIPSLSELNIEVERIERDPLLIANVYGRPYLVAKWNVLGEEPYEHYLMEFTEKRARE